MKKSQQVFSSPLIYKILISFSTLSTISLFYWPIKYSNSGFDFTDEGFYLTWIANPFIYDVSVSQFGFVYHPLYSYLGGDIAALRQANIFITLALSWGLAYCYIRSLVPDLKVKHFPLLLLSAAFASTSLILFNSSLFTPSYNSLNFQALLIASTGLVLADKNIKLKSLSGWFLIGVGGWLAFMAKPTTAFALAVGIIIFLLFLNKSSFGMIVFSAISALCLLLTSAILIDGSILDFINRLKEGHEFGKYMGGGHTLSQILRVDNFPLNTTVVVSILLVACVVFLLLWSLCAKNRLWPLFGLLISSALLVLIFLVPQGLINQFAHLGKYQGFSVFGIIFGVLVTTFLIGPPKVLKTIAFQQWVIGVLFLVMPHIYAFGTGSNYWKKGSDAAFFWILAAITLLVPLSRKRASLMLLVPIALAAQSLTIISLQTGFSQPYRQKNPLWLNSSNVKIGSQQSEIILSKCYAEYISDAQSVLNKSGFKPNTPMIDLTGQSPGLLYSIGAESIGKAWTIGGYPGSLRLAKAALDYTPCVKIANAWILHEQDGPRSIPNELLISLGLDFPNSYRKAGEWNTAEGAGGYKKSRTQVLYEPIEIHQNLVNCRKVRHKPTQ